MDKERVDNVLTPLVEKLGRFFIETTTKENVTIGEAVGLLTITTRLLLKSMAKPEEDVKYEDLKRTFINAIHLHDKLMSDEDALFQSFNDTIAN